MKPPPNPAILTQPSTDHAPRTSRLSCLNIVDRIVKTPIKPLPVLGPFAFLSWANIGLGQHSERKNTTGCWFSRLCHVSAMVHCTDPEVLCTESCLKFKFKILCYLFREIYPWCHSMHRRHLVHRRQLHETSLIAS